MRKTDPAAFGGGRRRPYTVAGIHRLLCSVRGCGRQAWATWSGCADDNMHRPLCPEHDVELNAIASRWWGDPEAEAKLEHYRQLVEDDVGDALALTADLRAIPCSESGGCVCHGDRRRAA